ncbi:glutathione S-transferase T3-like [Hordeum vulgare]|nr:glutathione S-transferase T3-like [Hordeum vulgare]
MKERFDLYNKSEIDRTERSLRSRWSTINKDCQKWAGALTAVDTLNPSGTNDRDRKKTKKGKIKKGRPFTLPHCYDALKNGEKWRSCEGVNEESNKRKRIVDLDDDEEESSSDGGKRSPTPNSVAYSKPNGSSGGKKDGKEKKKRTGDDELKNSMEAIMSARKEANEVRKMARNQDAAAEERRLATEERRVTAEERKVALEDKKLAMEERTRLLEWEKYSFFIMDTSTLDEQQKEYVKFAREEVLVQKRGMAIGGMGATMGGMGGMRGMSGFGVTMDDMEGMGGFEATMGGMGGMDGIKATMGGMGGMSFASLMGGMRAPPGGHMSSGVPPYIPSHDVLEDLANTYRA